MLENSEKHPPNFLWAKGDVFKWICFVWPTIQNSEIFILQSFKTEIKQLEMDLKDELLIKGCCHLITCRSDHFIPSNVGMLCVCLGKPAPCCIFISVCACVWSSVTLWLCRMCMYVYPAMDECSIGQAACVLSAASQETCSRQAEC